MDVNNASLKHDMVVNMAFIMRRAQELLCRRATTLASSKGLREPAEPAEGCSKYDMSADYNLTSPWYTDFIGSREPRDADFYVPAPKSIVDVPIGALSGVFLLLSAADHLFVVLPGVNNIYNRNLQQNRNPFRWIEYAVSASVMRVQIAMLSGTTSITLLAAIFALTGCTMLFGWLMEDQNSHKLDGSHAVDIDGFSSAKKAANINWTPFIMGCLPHLAAWALVATYFFYGVSNGDPPGFVWAIIFILFTLDASFAVVQFLQFKQVKFLRGLYKAEFAYIILSLTAKQLLAWIQYGGSNSLDQ